MDFGGNNIEGIDSFLIMEDSPLGHLVDELPLIFQTMWYNITINYSSKPLFRRAINIVIISTVKMYTNQQTKTSECR